MKHQERRGSYLDSVDVRYRRKMSPHLIRRAGPKLLLIAPPLSLAIPRSKVLRVDGVRRWRELPEGKVGNDCEGACRGLVLVGRTKIHYERLEWLLKGAEGRRRRSNAVEFMKRSGEGATSRSKSDVDCLDGRSGRFDGRRYVAERKPSRDDLDAPDAWQADVYEATLCYKHVENDNYLQNEGQLRIRERGVEVYSPKFKIGQAGYLAKGVGEM